MSEAVEVLKALLTPVIAIIAVGIAYFQYKLARHKQDVEVYDRRLRIYTRTIQYLRRIEMTGGITADDYHRWELLRFEAQFLFDSAVIKHLERIDDVTSDLLATTAMDALDETLKLEKEAPGTKAARLFNEATSLVGLTELVFAPYFQLVHRRHRLPASRSYDSIRAEHEAPREPAKPRVTGGPDIPF